MSKRVLLVSVNRCDAPYPVFPLGLACLQTALERAGYQTRWVDRQFDDQPIAAALASFQPDHVGVSLRNIDDVLIRRKEQFLGPLVEACQEIRRASRVPIILGGSGFSLYPEQLMRLTGAEFGIQGEGEISLVALLNMLEDGGDFSAIPGLVLRRGDRIIANPTCPMLPEQLVPASRDETAIRAYLDSSSMLNIQTQRGCACRCLYCTYPLIEGRSFRRRAPESVAEEMEELQARGARYIVIVDSIFNSTPEHVRDVCEAIIRRGLKLQWGCFLRPAGITPEMMRLMARAGLAHVEFGSDSFCDEVLESYRKGFSFEEIRLAHGIAREAGVDCCHFLVCGGPGETVETMETSFRNSFELEGAVILAVVGMRVYPGTGLCSVAQNEGRIKQDSDLLEPCYYLSEAVTEELVFERLREFSRKSPNWIAGDPPPRYAQMAERLRKRGIIGPLWSYFSLMQRLAFPTSASSGR